MFCLNQRLLNNRILEGRTHYFFSGSCILTTSIPSPFILMDRSYLIKNPARQEACPQPQLLSQPFPVRKAESLRRSTILLPVLPEAHSGDGRDYTSFFRTRTGFLPTSLPPSPPSMLLLEMTQVVPCRFCPFQQHTICTFKTFQGSQLFIAAPLQLCGFPGESFKMYGSSIQKNA